MATPLHYAAFHNLTEVAQKLADYSAELSPRNSEGNTPIQIAVTSGHRDMIDLFLSTPGVDVNTRNKAGHTALWLALGLDDQDIAQKLVDRGCDINLQTASGDSMLHYAVGTENEKAALFLIEHGAETNLSNDKRETPLHIAATLGLVNVLTALIARQTGVNAQDKELRTPLMRAILNQHKRIVDILLQQDRLEVNLANNTGECALGLALSTGQLDIAQSLLGSGAEIDATHEGETHLHRTLDNPETKFVQSSPQHQGQ
jgi:ankyrin repeat protein